jgi:hypothetical protein
MTKKSTRGSTRGISRASVYGLRARAAASWRSMERRSPSGRHAPPATCSSPGRRGPTCATWYWCWYHQHRGSEGEPPPAAESRSNNDGKPRREVGCTETAYSLVLRAQPAHGIRAAPRTVPTGQPTTAASRRNTGPLLVTRRLLASDRPFSRIPTGMRGWRQPERPIPQSKLACTDANRAGY